jgi:hypothetical protein
MRSVERKFNKINKKNPYWSSWNCFVNAIKGQDFNKRIILKWFNKLIDKNDYAKNEKKELIKHLLKVSSTPEECQKQA